MRIVGTEANMVRAHEVYQRVQIFRIARLVERLRCQPDMVMDVVDRRSPYPGGFMPKLPPGTVHSPDQRQKPGEAILGEQHFEPGKFLECAADHEAIDVRFRALAERHI